MIWLTILVVVLCLIVGYLWLTVIALARGGVELAEGVKRMGRAVDNEIEDLRDEIRSITLESLRESAASELDEHYDASALKRWENKH